MKNIDPSDILDFWFSDKVTPLHFVKNPDFDAEITDKFQHVYQEAASGSLDDWKKTAEGSLALIIILDQFPRNMFRNTKKAFATDDKAVEIAKHSIENSFEKYLTKDKTAFLYMPFMHSENVKEQELSVGLYRALEEEENIKYALAHHNIIKHFGRFPHRNEILKRKSNEEEIKFLKGPNSNF